MRRFDRTYMNFTSSNDDENRVALPREDNWMKSTIDHLATTQNKLHVNVSQNCENIRLCRQENVAVAENLRSAVTMWQQFGEKLTRLTDQMEFERNSFESVTKETSQKLSHLSGQFRQLMNGGLQFERNISGLEEEVIRLKQTSEQANKKAQQMNDKINELQQQLDKQANAVDISIQDLRQLSHQTENSTKKTVRGMLHDIDHKIENEEQERKDDNIKIYARLKSLETGVNELKKSKNYSNGDYAALMEEKDQEYKAELKNFLMRVKNHIEESSSGSHPENGKLLEEIRKKLRSVEQKLLAEEEARADGLKRLEEETAKHFKRVSGHIIQQLDILGTAINGNGSNPNINKELAEVRTEIEETKSSINRVLRAEITARKSQAQKFNSSIEDFEKQKSQTVKVLRDAIAEMKAYIDKELEAKTEGKNRHHHIIPKLDKRISDVEKQLMQQINESKNSPTPDDIAHQILPTLDKKLSDLQKKLERQMLEQRTPTSDNDITNEKVSSLERSIMDLRKRIKRQDEELQKSAKADEIEQEILPTLDKKLSELQRKLERQILEQKTPISDFDFANEKVDKLERHMMELQKRMKRQHEECQVSTSNYETMNRHLNNLESNIKDLLQKNFETREDVEELQKKPILEDVMRELFPSVDRKLLNLQQKLERQIFIQQSPTNYDKIAHEKMTDIEREIMEIRHRILEQEKEYEKSPTRNEITKEILVTLENKLSELQEKLERQILEQQRQTSHTYMKTPITPKQDREILRRLSKLEGKLKWHLSVVEEQKPANNEGKKKRIQTADCHRMQLKAKPPPIRRNSSYLKIVPTKSHSKDDKQFSYLHLSRDRLRIVEQKLHDILLRVEETEDELEILDRRTKREIIIDRKLRNKLIEFINKRCLEGKHLQLFIKSFGIHQIKYFMDYTGKKLLLNKWGVYQALRMYQFKKRWLDLIQKKPLELTLKEYREIIREEREKERERIREERKKPISPIIVDSFSDSETEEEIIAEQIPETNKEPEVEEQDEEEEKEKEPEGPKRINYEEDSGDNYIQYKTDDDDDEESDDEFFPQTSEDEDDYKLFSDEDDNDDEDDDEDDDEEEDEEEGKDGEKDNEDENDENDIERDSEVNDDKDDDNDDDDDDDGDDDDDDEDDEGDNDDDDGGNDDDNENDGSGDDEENNDGNSDNITNNNANDSADDKDDGEKDDEEEDDEEEKDDDGDKDDDDDDDGDKDDDADGDDKGDDKGDKDDDRDDNKKGNMNDKASNNANERSKSTKEE